MTWDDDGLYRRCVAVKAKNYVLQKYKEDLKPGEKEMIIKGSAFKSANKEPALKEMMQEFVNCLINDKNDIFFLNIFKRYIIEAMNIQDISRWAVKKTVTDKVLNGDRTQEVKVMNAIGLDVVQEGDKIYVYNAIVGEVQAVAKGEPVVYKNGLPKMIPNRILVQTKDFNVSNYDRMHYVERVYDTVSILQTVLKIELFPKYHLKNANLLLTDLCKNYTI